MDPSTVFLNSMKDELIKLASGETTVDGLDLLTGKKKKEKEPTVDYKKIDTLKPKKPAQ